MKTKTIVTAMLLATAYVLLVNLMFLSGFGKDEMVKVGWYSGRNHLAPEIDLQYFDYVKLGPYVEERGGLDNPNTNQVMLEIDNTCGRSITKDITSYFWHKSN